MELRHIRIFLALAEELHFGRASARLHVAQSAVSQTLRDLESELETRLFLRTSRQVKLTEAGQNFLSYAREAIQVVDRGVRAARAAPAGCRRLKIRMLPVATLTALPSLLARFQRENPQIELEVRDGTSARNLEALADAFCDVALVSVAAAKSVGAAYAQATLELSPLCLVMPARHRLARRKVIKPEELRGERILPPQRDDEPEVRQRFDTRLANLGTVPIGIELSQPQALLPLVAAGLGVALLPAFVTSDSRLALSVVPIAGPIRAGVIAVWHKQRASEATRQFVELVSRGTHAGA